MEVRYVLIWSGRGLLALLILLLSFALPLIAAVFIVQSFPNTAPAWLIPVGAYSGQFIGGFLCWWLGRTWRVKVPSASGHTLYFVPVEYWGVLLMLFVVIQVIGHLVG